MNRFQIEDIIEQDEHGVVFRAHDVESGRAVALRRFLPFGQDGGGLTKEEALAFEIAALRLAEVSHVALRSVIMGSVDPIDGIPYLVTEWVDGVSLRDALGGESLHPSLVIDVLRVALEVSTVLSHVLGEEAVWVETEVASIVVGERESGRGFTFWISPFKWLGGEFESRSLSAITGLGEELAGWKRKVVSDHAGNGLGGWLNWARENPDARLGEALEKLSECTSGAPPPNEADLIERSINPSGLQIRQPSAKMPLVFAACAALIVLAAALYYLHKTSNPPKIEAAYVEQPISPVIRNSAPVVPAAVVKAAEAPPVHSKAADVNARLEELSRQASEATAKAEAEKKAATEAVAVRGGVLTAADKKLLMEMKQDQKVQIGGILRAVNLSSSGKGMYLLFSETLKPDETGVVIYRDSFKGKFVVETFTPMMGKNIIVRGSKHRETADRVFVQVRSADAVSIVK